MEPKIKGLGSILDFCVGIIIMRSDFEEGGRGGGRWRRRSKDVSLDKDITYMHTYIHTYEYKE